MVGSPGSERPHSRQLYTHASYDHLPVRFTWRKRGRQCCNRALIIDFKTSATAKRPFTLILNIIIFLLTLFPGLSIS